MRIHLSIPYFLLKERLEEVLSHGISPEVYFDAETLEGLDLKELKPLCRALFKKGLTCTVHAPYSDLSPGAIDPEVRRLTLRRFYKLLETAVWFSPLNVVFHPGYMPMVHKEYLEEWVKRAQETWYLVGRRAEQLGLVISLENVFEEGPEVLKGLFEGIGLPFGFCFDLGHWFTFANSDLGNWMEAFSDRLLEVHLHDNHGSKDEHLPPGEGRIDFLGLLPLLPGKDALIFTVEVYEEAKALKALEAAKSLLEASSASRRIS